MRHVPTRNRVFAIAATLIVMQAASTGGQEVPLTLGAARAAARRASPLVATARAAAEAAAGQARQAGALPNPVVVYSREETSSANARNAQDIAAFEQRLDLLARPSRTEAAKLRREAAEARLSGALAELDFEVARAWAETIAADRRAALADTAAGQFREAVRVVGERFEAGDASGYEARRLELEAARYAALAAEAHRAERSARLRLATLTGVSPDVRLPSLGDVIRAEPISAPSPDSAAALAIALAPELQAVVLEARAAEADARLARRLRLPQPVVTAGYKNERVMGESQSLSGFVAGLSLSIPAWSRNSGAVAAADAEYRRALAQVDAIRLRVSREVLAAHDAATRAAAQVAALAAQLGAESEAALLAARTAYGEGEISLLEFLDTVRAYREAEVAFTSVVAESIIQRAELERLLGFALLR